MADNLEGFAAQVGADVGALQAVASIGIPLTADWKTDVQTVVEAYRSGNVVTIMAWRLAVSSGVTGDVVAYTVPPGYRPAAFFVDQTLDSRDKTVKISASNQVIITDPSGSVSHHSFTYITLDPPLV
ncbi:hypothetical protein [Brachybacterium tyrofermentans]|uniref:hypothetical protein n=1 Tax=Brachybacterium tyrofermentans TaxID=47848 RepID=UPI003FD10208